MKRTTEIKPALVLKTALKHVALATLLALPLGTAMGSGCTQAQEVCEIICECHHCSDRAEQDCLIEVDRLVEVAAAYDCTGDMDKYVDCLISDNDCDDSQFSADDCNTEEFADLLDCVDDNSDIINIVSAAAGQGQGGQPGQGGAMP